jgi:hypothetical protein
MTYLEVVAGRSGGAQGNCSKRAMRDLRRKGGAGGKSGVVARPERWADAGRTERFACRFSDLERDARRERRGSVGMANADCKKMWKEAGRLLADNAEPQ